MARTRKTIYDPQRTEQLALEELFAENISSPEADFVVWSHTPPPRRCPFCGGTEIKTHTHAQKIYQDILPGTQAPVSLQYHFYKYRCLNPDCKKIFALPTRFASANDHVTHRLEDQIARWVIEGCTYEHIAGLLQDHLTNAAIGQIFNRWVTKRDAGRHLSSPPAHLAILSGKLEHNKDTYIVFLNLDDGIRILEILYNPGAADVLAVLKWIGLENISLLLSDCNPIITDLIQDCCPGIPHVIPADFWFQMVSEDYLRYLHDFLKWSPIKKKDELVLMQPEMLAYRKDSLDRLLETRPEIRQPYDDYNRLRTILHRRDELWIYRELEEWCSSLDTPMHEALSPSILLLQQLRQPIESQLQYRDQIPPGLSSDVHVLEELLSDQHFRTFSNECLKARALYCTGQETDNWTGVPIRTVINVLQHILKSKTEEDRYV